MRGVFIHGIGTQSRTFADEARRLLRASFASKGATCWFKTIHWAPLADEAEQAFAGAVARRGSALGPAQRLAISTLADVPYYMGSQVLRGKIGAMVQEAAYELGGSVWFAHSMGAQILVDWMATNPEPGVRPVAIVTMGANIGLTSMGRALPLPEWSKAIPWTNLYFPADMLGFPLAVRPELEHVTDVLLEPDTGVNATGLAHTAYWQAGWLWSRVIPEILAGLRLAW